ncbi:DUF3465 domain-containing protein [Planctomycetaceae bacterium]|nr:DUF3465 domain-containing protein [Planctomycetaceae bacterium]
MIFISIGWLVAYLYTNIDDQAQVVPQRSEAPPKNVVSLGDADLVLSEAFENHQSDVQVMGHGTVDRVLPDDNKGSRHQRFILKLDSGQTVMVAHNIDVAAKIKTLQAGDRVVFYAEYEWNAQGGVLHWTHRASHGNHPGGWLKHDGQRYE